MVPAPSDRDRVKITLVLNLLYLYGDSFLFEYLWGDQMCLRPKIQSHL